MSDEMKPISEDDRVAAGDAPRRDSAQAAALTVGSPSSSSTAKSSARASKRGAFSTATRAGIAALAVVSALFIGVSAFALTDGFGLPSDSPIIKAAQSVGIVHAASESDVGSAASSADSAHNPAKAKHAASGESGDEAVSEGEGSEEEASENAEDASDEADGAADPAGSSDAKSDASSAAGSARSNSGSSGSGSTMGSSSSSQPSSPASSNASTSTGGSTDSSASSSSSLITVYVSVSSSAVGNPVSGGGTFTFNQGATVYDALCACGLSMSASNTGYGVYVAAIGGLAEKEHGSMSGWMYSVNGVVPMTACSNYTLQNGDSVSWYYVAG